MLRSNSKKAIGNLGEWLLKTETGWDKDPTTAEEERTLYDESEAEAKLCALVWTHYVSKAYYKMAFGW